MALLVGVVAADLAIPRLTQRVINEGIVNQDLDTIVLTALLMLAAAILSAVFAVGNTLLSVRVALGVGADLRSAIVRKVQTFSFGNLDRIQTGQLLVRTTSDVNMLQTMVLMSLRILTRAPLWMLGSIVMLFLTSVRLGLLLLALVPLIWGLIWIVATRARPLFLRVQSRLDNLNRVLQENLAGVRVVKAFDRAVYENQRFERANTKLTADNIRVMQLLALLIPAMMLLVNLGIVGVVWFGGGRVVEGTFSAGEIVASINYMSYSLFPMLMLGGMVGPIAAADASASRIWGVLDSVSDVQNPPDALVPAPSQSALQGRVEFHNVSFRYNGNQNQMAGEGGGVLSSKKPAEVNRAVLRDVTLAAEPGQTVAILGATGSGKSSLVHLIPRFYDVSEGAVYIDGTDVRRWPLDALRRQVGIALQETVLFSGTIRENIRYGRPEAGDEEVIAAAKAAQAHAFISSLPQGYDTVLGQRGVNLSGGQKQRLAIARALLVRPTILILDDSTSAVDVETEAKIQAELELLMKGRTSFVIAQRISTVLGADRIVVLDRGRVAAEGTHAELMASSPIYREIYQSQLGALDSANVEGRRDDHV